MKKIQELALAMINYDNGDPKRIQHTTKVHAYASLIGIGEGLDEDTQFILEVLLLSMISASGQARRSMVIRMASFRNRKVLPWLVPS